MDHKLHKLLVGLQNEQDADSHATALYQIAYWEESSTSVPQIVTTFTPPSAASYEYYWESLVNVSAWALSGEASLIPIGKLVHGTPTDGQRVVWNTTNSRLEWADQLIAAGGTAGQIPVWSPTLNRWVAGNFGTLLASATWDYDTADQFITIDGDPAIPADDVSAAALAGGIQTLLNNISTTPGTSGWSPIFSLVTDGERRVLRLAIWTGGTGSQPAGAGQYVGPSGLTSTLANAIDIRGAAGVAGAPGSDGTIGSDGNTGYSPVLQVVADSARRVLRIASWTGGTGPQPTGVGQYLSASGLTSTIADAIDIRGAPGSAGVGVVDQDDIDASVSAHNTSNTAHTNIRDVGFRGTWSSSINYPRGATVVYADELWQAETNPSSGEGAPRHYIGSPWHKISNSIRWRGSDTITAYQVGDIEEAGGNVYLFVGGLNSSPTSVPPAAGWLNLSASSIPPITHVATATFENTSGKNSNSIYGEGTTTNLRLGYLRYGVTDEVRMRAGQYSGTDNVGFHTGTQVFGHNLGGAGSMLPTVPSGLSGLYSTATRLSLVVDASDLLWFSGGAIANTVILRYRKVGEATTTQHDLSQFVDAGGYREFWGVVTEKAFGIGDRYDVSFRLGGSVVNVIVSAGSHIATIGDVDSEDRLRGEVHAEIEQAKAAVLATITGMSGVSSFDQLSGTINANQIPDNRIIDRMINFSTISIGKLDLSTRQQIGQDGDIDGVTAGTGLTGGGDRRCGEFYT